MIPKRDIVDRAAEWGLAANVVEKDYVLGWILAAIALDETSGSRWIFKGGTCLKKCYFETYRFSEDLDFTLTEEAPYTEAELLVCFRRIAAAAEEMCGISFPLEGILVRATPKGGFQARMEYRGPLAMPTRPKIIFDLTKDEYLAGPFVRRPILHSYPDPLPDKARPTSYSLEELQAEKLRALVQRTRPRDLYDVVHLLEWRREQVDLERMANIFDEKCRAKGISTPPAAAILDLVRGSDELAGEWKNMLGHQLPSLPPLDATIDRLATSLALGFQYVAPVPLPRIGPAGSTQDVISPPGLALWGGVPFERIRYAAVARLLVEIEYDGRKRLVEPYSLRRADTGNLLLYVVELPDGHTKSPILKKIGDVRITETPFTPRYPIELIPGAPLLSPQDRGSSEAVPRRARPRRRRRS